MGPDVAAVVATGGAEVSSEAEGADDRGTTPADRRITAMGNAALATTVRVEAACGGKRSGCEESRVEALLVVRDDAEELERGR